MFSSARGTQPDNEDMKGPSRILWLRLPRTNRDAGEPLARGTALEVA